jgi:hypothetical protein
MVRSVFARPLWLVLLASLISGCGGSVASISGDVTYNGEPVGNGYITFTPSDGKGPITGGAIENGHYQVELTPGPKLVKIEAVKKVHFAQSSDEMAKKAAVNKVFGDGSGLIERADIIPPNAEGNNTNVTVEPGEQVRNFALKKPGGAKGR